MFMHLDKYIRSSVGADLSALGGRFDVRLNLLGKVQLNLTVPLQRKGPALSSLRFAQGQALSEAKDL